MIIKNTSTIIKTLLIGIIGGIIFNVLLLPLPWVLGPAFSIAIFTFFGNKVIIPQNLRDPFVGIVGVWLGKSFTVSIFFELSDWLLSIAFLFIYVPFSYFITFLFLIKIKKLPKAEAFFISSPGGLLDMALAAEEFGANGKQVGLIHIIRIFVTVFTIPNIILFLFPGSFERLTLWPTFNGNLVDFFLIIIIIPIGLYFGKIINLPGRRLFGPLIISAFLHITEIINLNAPLAIFILAQIIVGSFFGSNMNGINWKIAKKYIGHAITIVVLHSICMIPFILLLDALIDSRPEAIMLAFSPGGINEMGLVAASLNIQPAFVITHHFFRLLIVLFILAIAQKYIYSKLKL